MTPQDQMLNDFMVIMLYGICACITLYVLFRLVFTAYFNAKREKERRGEDET
jgi:hypothetical protein